MENILLPGDPVFVLKPRYGFRPPFLEKAPDRRPSGVTGWEGFPHSIGPGMRMSSDAERRPNDPPRHPKLLFSSRLTYHGFPSAMGMATQRPTRHQKGSMMRTMINVLVPTAWKRRPISEQNVLAAMML
jgi:hypothetical protein